jgi:hypothetical protein
MPPIMGNKHNRDTRFFVKPAVIVLLLVAVGIHLFLVKARFHYQQGVHQQVRGNPVHALDRLHKAEKGLPGLVGTWFTFQDRFRIYSEAGQAYYQAGQDNFRKNQDYFALYDTVKTGYAYLVRARNIDSRDYINTYWLARAEHTLERTHRLLFAHLENPYDAYDAYQAAMNLRPSSHTVRHWFVKYLVFRRMHEQIPAQVEMITEVYPPAYSALKREPFFDRVFMQAARQGLQNALDKNHLPVFALQGLTDIALMEGDLTAAIAHTKAILAYTPRQHISNGFFRLGELYVKSGQLDDCAQAFLKAVEVSRHPVNPINQIYDAYKKAGLLHEFLKFSVTADENNLGSLQLDMAVARCWLEKKQPRLARARLMKANARKPHAPAYYLLAQIARQEENWGQMELDMYQALQLDKNNKTYLRAMVTALKKQGKDAHAWEFERILERK